MKSVIITFLAFICVPLFAQSIAVTSPTNGAVVTYGFPLTAAITSAPSVTQVRFYIDGRLEQICNQVIQSVCTSPKMYNATYSDERLAQIYAEGYNTAGTKILTSSVNTFRLNNSGVNAVSTFNFGGVVTKGATISGTGTWTLGSNATVSSVTTKFDLDGVHYQQPLTVRFKNSTVNTSTGALTVPFMPFANGTQLNSINCTAAAGQGNCAGGDADLPAGLSNNIAYFIKVLAANSICLTLTAGGACVVPSTQGVTTEYTQLINNFPPGWSGSGPYTIDTTNYPNGSHRFTQVNIAAAATGNTGSFQFNSSIITGSVATSGIIPVTNFPLVQNQVATCGGTCPSQWTGTLYTQVQDANDWCFSLTQNGSCIGSLSGASGTLTISFTIPSQFMYPSGNQAQTLGTDINEFTFSNGAAAMALKTKYSKIVGIAGDTFTLAPFYLNTDGSTGSATHLTCSSSDTSRAVVTNSGCVVTLQSTTGHALISIVDNPTSSTGKAAQLIDAEVRPDRTTYKQFCGNSASCNGLLTAYDPAKSVFLTECFACDSLNVRSDTYSNPRKFLQPVFRAMQGGNPYLTPLNALTPISGCNSDYTSWFNNCWHGGNSLYSLAGTLASQA